jgi:hypothetical protein
MDVSFFGEMAWKSALISGAALALAYVLRSRAASDRALVLRLGIVMLLLLPIIAMALPALKIEAWAAPPAAAPMPAAYTPALALPAPDLSYALPADAGQQPAEAATIWDDPTPLVLLAYLGGLLMVGSRLLAGLVLLGRWTRTASAGDLPGMAGRVRARPPGRAEWRQAAPAGVRFGAFAAELGLAQSGHPDRSRHDGRGARGRRHPRP